MYGLVLIGTVKIKTITGGNIIKGNHVESTIYSYTCVAP